MIQEKAILQAAVNEGLLNEQDISQAKMVARRDQRDLLSTLGFLHRIPVVSFYRAYAQYHDLRFLNAAELKPNVKLARKCGYGLMTTRKLFPVTLDGSDERICVACAAAPDNSVKRQLVRSLGVQDIEYCLADMRAIETAIHQLEPVLNPLIDVTSNKTINDFDPVKELDDILDQAYLHRSSDVHFEPLKEQMMIRFRIDGSLQETPNRYNKEQAAGLISRIKVLSKLDIAETRMPQDGGMTHRVENGVEFDI